MTPEAFLEFALNVTFALLILSFFITTWRVIVGPTLPDRVLALDMLVAIVIGFIAAIAVKTGFELYIDVALALGLVGFLATVAFARLIVYVGTLERQQEDAVEKAREAEALARAEAEAAEAAKIAKAAENSETTG